MLERIGVLMGGISREKDISIQSGKAIYSALKRLGFDAHEIICEGNISEELRKTPIDIAFIALHGKYGEDGTIQMQLEQLGISYTGSGVTASSLAMNKKESKQIFTQKNIPTPPWTVISKGHFSMDFPFPFPVVVKPVAEGSSIGLSIINNEDLFRRSVISLLETHKEIIVEKFIKGPELTVGILDNEALPVIHIAPKRTFYDFIAKYEKGNTDYIVPADISESATKTVQETALAAHCALGCRDLSRVDLILSDDGTAYVLEINTIPGFTETSLLPKAAKARKMSFDQLCKKILLLAYQRKSLKIT